MAETLLELKNIHKWFGAVRALKGVNFQVKNNETVGLIGGNGAGKTTLSNIITGVYPPSKGEIYFEGAPVTISSVDEARKMGIETVFQDQAVIDSMSIRENVFLNREITTSFGPFEFLNKKKMNKETREITENLGLNIPSPEQEIRFCSGGERQGTAISRAMYFSAKLVILDEPTTALSPKGSQKMLGYIKKLKSEDTSSIFISHNLQHIYEIADRFVLLSQGEMVRTIQKDETTEEELQRLVLHE